MVTIKSLCAGSNYLMGVILLCLFAIMSAILGLQKYKCICSSNPINIDDNFHAVCMQIAVLMESNK